MRKLLILLVIAAATIGASQTDTDWKQYTVQDLKLAIDLPSKPTQSVKDIAPAGKWDVYTGELFNPLLAYSVSVMQDPVAEGVSLEIARDLMLAQWKKQPGYIDASPLNLKAKGLKMGFIAGDFITNGYACTTALGYVQVKDKLVMVSITYPSNSKASFEATSRILSSIHLLE